MKRIAILLLAAVAAFAGCAKKEEALAPHATTQAVMKGTKSAVVSPSSVHDDYEAVGTIRSRYSVAVASKLMGTISGLTVRVGERVSAGQPLAHIEAADMVAQIQKAEAGMREATEGLVELERAEAAAGNAIKGAEANQAFATSTFERFKTLAERGSLSRQEFEEAEARYKGSLAETDRVREMKNALSAKRNQIMARRDQAAADAANVRAVMAYSQITAPISGIVVAKPAENGTLAMPGMPMLIIEDEGQYRLEASADESLLRRMKIGDSVKVRIDALGGKEIEGRIDEFVPTADAASRTVTVKIALGEQKGLRPGLFGRAIFGGEERKTLLIPRSALVERGQLVGVFVVDPSKIAQLRLVKVGREYDGKVEIVSGLDGGETIVVEGVALVADGSRLE